MIICLSSASMTLKNVCVAFADVTLSASPWINRTCLINIRHTLNSSSKRGRARLSVLESSLANDGIPSIAIFRPMGREVNKTGNMINYCRSNESTSNMMQLTSVNISPIPLRDPVDLISGSLEYASLNSGEWDRSCKDQTISG